MFDKINKWLDGWIALKEFDAVAMVLNMHMYLQ